MDHVMGGGATGEFPEQAVKPTLNGPHRPCGLYVARFRNVPGARSKKFLRGYGFQGGGHSDFQLSGAGIWRGVQEIRSRTRHYSASLAALAKAWGAGKITWRSIPASGTHSEFPPCACT